VPIAEVITSVWDELLRARERGGEIVGVSTGFRDLDKLLHGLHATDLFILAARPAMGKTAFALNLGLEVARRVRNNPGHEGERNGVLIFSLEMGREQLVQRLLSSRSRVQLSAIRTGQVVPDDEILLREAAAELSELRVFIDDMAGVSIVDVRARAKRMAMSGPVDLIVVDYLQLMKGTGGAKQSREQEISEISRGLKGLAKEMHCTVMALSQLNRGVEHRTDKRPMMADLRESGAIEQDADIIAFVYRDHVYNKDAPEHDAELIVVKHRAGETGTVLLHFDGRMVRFSNRDHQMDDRYAGMA
jgi:replicative DNA helicase